MKISVVSKTLWRTFNIWLAIILVFPIQLAGAPFVFATENGGDNGHTKVVICHNPGPHQVEISVDEHAVDTHIGQHGDHENDYRGECEPLDDDDGDEDGDDGDGDYPPPAPVCGNSVLEGGEQCDDGNTNNGDGCSSQCQLETFQCGDITDGAGWYGEYFNYSSGHPDMEQYPVDTDHGNDPLGNWTADWYTEQYFRFSRVDSALTFGENFFPFDSALEEENNGHDYHFGVHWRALVEGGPGSYNFSLTSDDDAWVYVNGILAADNSGLHAPTTVNGALALSGSDIVDVFFAERNTVQSHMNFTFDGEHTITPLPERCQPEVTICKLDDLLGDGASESNDTPIAGWGVGLLDKEYPVIETELAELNLVGGGISPTEENGCYTFKNLLPGSYRAVEEKKVGWAPTAAAPEGMLGQNILTGLSVEEPTPAIDSFFDVFVDIELDWQDKKEVNFYNYVAGICGIKFGDENADGERNENELGISGWGITLVEKNICEAGDEWADGVESFGQGLRSDGSAVAAERSDASEALGVAENDDTVNFVSLGIGGTLVLSFDNLIENGAGDDIAVTETSYGSPSCEAYPERVRVFASQTGDTDDWTELGTGCLDATFDLGALPWAKYVKLVDITDPENFDGVVDGYDVDGVRALYCMNLSESFQMAETDGNGEFCFVDLEPGWYQVTEESRTGWKPTTDESVQIYFDGEEKTHVAFGNIQLGSIHGMKFFDIDGDGEKDENEIGLFGWSIELYEAPSGPWDQSTPVATTTTMGDGWYWFDNLPPGIYNVLEVNQNGWTQTAPTPDQDDYRYYTIEIGYGGFVDNAHFGNQSLEPGSIYGSKFHDENGNGEWDEGEEGLAGWEIELRRVIGDTEELLSSTTTIPGGGYGFFDLAPGLYRVSETNQNGWVQTYPLWGCSLVDYNDDGVVGTPDFIELRQISSAISECLGDPATGDCAIGDLNEDGVVGTPDWVALHQRFQLLSACLGENVTEGSESHLVYVVPGSTNEGYYFGNKNEEDQGGGEDCSLVDYNDDGVVGTPDFIELRQISSAISECLGDPATGDCAIGDLNEDGVVGTPDWAIFRQTYGLFVSCFGQEIGAPLLILNEGSDEPEGDSITVTWDTNKLSTSRVVYGTTSVPVLGPAPNYGYSSSTIMDPTLVTNHAVVISDLVSGTTYYWRAVSNASPEVVGDEQTFSVPSDENGGNDNDGGEENPSVTTTTTSGGGGGGGGPIGLFGGQGSGESFLGFSSPSPSGSGGSGGVVSGTDGVGGSLIADGGTLGGEFQEAPGDGWQGIVSDGIGTTTDKTEEESFIDQLAALGFLGFDYECNAWTSILALIVLLALAAYAYKEHNKKWEAMLGALVGLIIFFVVGAYDCTWLLTLLALLIVFLIGWDLRQRGSSNP